MEIGNTQTDSTAQLENSLDVADLIPRSEAKTAFAARDRAKAEVKLLAATLGIDPATIKVVPTGDPEIPFKLEADGLEDVSAALQAARQTPSMKTKIAEQQRVAMRNQLSAYEKFIDGIAVDAELRAAFAAQKAVDLDGTGKFADLIKLVRDRVKIERVIDQETGELKVSVTGLDARGNPILDSHGEPCGPDAAVADFLAARPALKRATAMRGIGAGGYGNGSLQPSGRITPPIDRGEYTASRMFGKIGDPAARFFPGDKMFGQIGKR